MELHWFSSWSGKWRRVRRLPESAGLIGMVEPVMVGNDMWHLQAALGLASGHGQIERELLDSEPGDKYVIVAIVMRIVCAGRGGEVGGPV